MLLVRHVEILKFIKEHPGLASLDIAAYFRSMSVINHIDKLSRIGYINYVNSGYFIDEKYSNLIEEIFYLKGVERERIQQRNIVRKNSKGCQDDKN